jgi:DNA-binding NtrC family response regulator
MEKRAVLFVDDDEILLKTIEKSFTDEPYDKYFAMSGEDALEILKRGEVHIIIVDLIMPGMGGIELLKIVKKEYPNIVSMVISGYAQSADAMMALSELGVYRFIVKSWTLDEDVRRVIQQVIDHYNLQGEHEDMVEELKLCSDRTISAK